MAKSNFPNAQIDNLPTEYVSKTIGSVQELAALGKITRSPEDDEEFEKRINLIINFCKERGLRPGIELLCCGLGISRQELHNWQNGVGNTSSRRQEGVRQIKQMIFCFLEQCGLSSHINPATLIWLQRNWQGYTETIKIETGNANREIPVRSAEEIAAAYMDVEEPEPIDSD